MTLSASAPVFTMPRSRNSTYRLQAKETPEPSATSVSMLGERCLSAFKPLVKNFRLISMTPSARSICKSARAMWL